MKLYLVNDSDGRALRIEGTQADAKSAAKIAEGDFEQIEVPTDKNGLIEFLNSGNPLSSRPAEDEYDTVVERQDPVVAKNVDVRVDLEDAWDQLPLATQLHYAARAVEDARDQIKPASTKTVGEPVAEEPEEVPAEEADDSLFE